MKNLFSIKELTQANNKRNWKSTSQAQPEGHEKLAQLETTKTSMDTQSTRVNNQAWQNHGGGGGLDLGQSIAEVEDDEGEDGMNEGLWSYSFSFFEKEGRRCNGCGLRN